VVSDVTADILEMLENISHHFKPTNRISSTQKTNSFWDEFAKETLFLICWYASISLSGIRMRFH
jgi:hypothetical protein